MKFEMPEKAMFLISDENGERIEERKVNKDMSKYKVGNDVKTKKNNEWDFARYFVVITLVAVGTFSMVSGFIIMPPVFKWGIIGLVIWTIGLFMFIAGVKGGEIDNG